MNILIHEISLLKFKSNQYSFKVDIVKNYVMFFNLWKDDNFQKAKQAKEFSNRFVYNILTASNFF